MQEFRDQLNALGETNKKHYLLTMFGPAGEQNFSLIQLAWSPRLYCRQMGAGRCGRSAEKIVARVALEETMRKTRQTWKCKWRIPGAERVKTVIGENPQSGHLFVFRSRRGDRLKILVWDRDGFVLWYKRLEAGVFKLPRVEPGARSVELRASELAMILDGIDVSKLQRLPRYQRAIESRG